MNIHLQLFEISYLLFKNDSLSAWKVDKLILRVTPVCRSLHPFCGFVSGPVPRCNQFSLFRDLHGRLVLLIKFHGNRSTTFWLILFDVKKSISLHVEKWKKWSCTQTRILSPPVSKSNRRACDIPTYPTWLDLPTNFHENRSTTFWVILFTHKHTNRRTNKVNKVKTSPPS